MLEQDLYQYCFYYRGEALMPARYDQKNEGKLWEAEKAVCEGCSHLIDERNPRKRMASLIASYVAKWAPYKLHDVMATYFKNAPDLQASVMAVYSS